MNIFFHRKAQNTKILYPDEVRSDERKILPFCFVIMLFFFILGVQRTLTAHSVEWSFLIFTGVPSFTILVELFRVWRPILMINEQKVKIRTHPFLPRVKLYWYEISAITRYREKGNHYLGFTLSPAHGASFLQRQDFFSRKIFVRRLGRSNFVARLSPSDLPRRMNIDTLFKDIYKQYQAQIREYGIRVLSSCKL